MPVTPEAIPLLSPASLPGAAAGRIATAENIVAGAAHAGIEAALPLLGPAAVLGLTIYGFRKMLSGVLGTSTNSLKTLR